MIELFIFTYGSSIHTSKLHIGRKNSRIREIRGMKQDHLAMEMVLVSKLFLRLSRVRKWKQQL